MDNYSSSVLPENDKFYKHFKGLTLVNLTGPDRYLLPKHAPEVLQTLKSFKARDDDIYVVTFPKTGTTWLQEIVYLIMNDVDCEKAKSTTRDRVFPYLEMNMMELPPEFQLNEVDSVENLPSPRLIKSHLPYCLLPPEAVAKKSKFLYVSRNAKDTMISYFHFALNIFWMKFQGDLNDFAELFLEGKIPFAPYIPHVKEFWEHRHDSNVFFTTYEALKQNQEPIIGEIAKFLNKPLTDGQIKTIANHCNFDNMKHNAGANKANWNEQGFLANKDFKFMRKGIVGDCKNHMSPELIAKFDKWIIEQTGGSDVKDIM
uniref:Sulfotransferase domain-containing protein n=1 Tax=Strigamia maritima TaxID=126957 RepID=T1II81_STRMM